MGLRTEVTEYNAVNRDLQSVPLLGVVSSCPSMRLGLYQGDKIHTTVRKGNNKRAIKNNPSLDMQITTTTKHHP
jgi:hypothetical protein